MMFSSPILSGSIFSGPRKTRTTFAFLAIALLALGVLIPDAAAQVLTFGSPEGANRYRTEPGRYLQGLLAGLESLILLVFVVRLVATRTSREALRRALGRPRLIEILALTSLVAVGFLVRVLVATPAPILSTFNDIKHVHDSMCLADQATACELTPAYPPGVAGLHAVLFRLAGPSRQLIYWTNASLGALTIALAWALGLLFGSGWGTGPGTPPSRSRQTGRALGWIMAVGLTALPLHIRFSASGAYTTGFLFFSTLAFVGLLLFARTRAPRDLWILGLAATLAVQSRMEAPSIVLPLLLATLVVVPHVWRVAFEPRMRRHTTVVMLLIAAGCLPALSALAGSDGHFGPGGLGFVGFKVGVAVLVPLTLWGAGWLVDRLVVPHRRHVYGSATRDGVHTTGRLRLAGAIRWVVGLSLTGLGAAVLIDVTLFPARHLLNIGAWPAFAENGLLLPSYSDWGIPILNPRSIGAPFILLALVGLAGSLHRDRRGPVAVLLLWAGLITALGMQKNTGSIPFEHMRTAVSASVAVVGLAAFGVRALTSLLPEERVISTIVTTLLGLSLAASPLLTVDMLRDRGFNNEQQIDFLERALPSLPPHAVVVYPNKTVEGQHPFAELFRIPEVWWTLGHIGPARSAAVARDDRFLGAQSALAAPRRLLALRDTGFELLWWEGLACWRTGRALHPMRDDCRRMEETFELTPLSGETITNKPFESDFFRDYLIWPKKVTIQVYRIDGLRGSADELGGAPDDDPVIDGGN